MALYFWFSMPTMPASLLVVFLFFHCPRTLKHLSLSFTLCVVHTISFVCLPINTTYLTINHIFVYHPLKIASVDLPFSFGPRFLTDSRHANAADQCGLSLLSRTIMPIHPQTHIFNIRLLSGFGLILEGSNSPHTAVWVSGSKWIWTKLIIKYIIIYNIYFIIMN